MNPKLLRVLVVEDDFVQALQVADVLADLRCEVVGPITTMHEALQSLTSERLDAIVTDLDLNGRLAFPLTRAATQRGVPIAIITAYSPEFSVNAAPVLEKPCSPEKLRTFLASFLKGVERKTHGEAGPLTV